ncbi:MAG: twin-arginine translocase subunit TatB [Rhodobacter sp.]|nr:twin-arginine translocase subunit TatB [Rhodobacter sp.]
MFDIGWSELLIIGVVALIVIGPKDLPEMFRTLGRFTAKARSMSRDFQRAMEAAAKDSGVDTIARDVKSVVSPKNLGLDAVRDAATRFEKWDPLKPAPKPVIPAAAATPTVPAPVTAPAVVPIGPATAALAAAKTNERAATLAAAENRIAAPVAPAPPAAATGPKARKSADAKAAEPAPAKPATAKADATPKPRTPRKAPAEGRDA